MSALSAERTIGELVAEQPARSRIFERLGIDYCCGGKRSLTAACESRGIPTGDVLNALAEQDATEPAPDVDWASASITGLTTHLENTHHAYLKEALPRLTDLTEKVANAHGRGDARLTELRDLFVSFRSELESHMAKEEMVLFPMCRKLDGANAPANFQCGGIENPIRVMVAEHDDAGRDLAKMRLLTDGFNAPAGACNTYRAMIQALAELEEDMHRHVHIENFVLFPRAIAAADRAASAA